MNENDLTLIDCIPIVNAVMVVAKEVIEPKRRIVGFKLDSNLNIVSTSGYRKIHIRFPTFENSPDLEEE